jgi:hypothetical protein
MSEQQSVVIRVNDDKSDNGSEYINHNEFKLDTDDSITKKKLGGEIVV